jgi:hypothetical protein
LVRKVRDRVQRRGGRHRCVGDTAVSGHRQGLSLEKQRRSVDREFLGRRAGKAKYRFPGRLSTRRAR